MSFSFSAMILAAGFGKRLMPLTKDIPKPLIYINGITLLDNSINFLKKLGCNQIIINTHYQHQKIKTSIGKRESEENITLINEKEILDTGGGVKNAISLFKNDNLLIINSDVFWQKENLNDAQSLIDTYKNNPLPHMLLVYKKNAYGLSKINGDFTLKKNIVSRFITGDEIIFYSGLQILNIDIFSEFLKQKFSFNIVWDSLINQQKLFGQIMHSNLYHVGDIQGLNLAKELCS